MYIFCKYLNNFSGTKLKPNEKKNKHDINYSRGLICSYFQLSTEIAYAVICNNISLPVSGSFNQFVEGCYFLVLIEEIYLYDSMIIISLQQTMCLRTRDSVVIVLCCIKFDLSCV